MVKLVHESGSGGSTLAMQVLWDLRRTHRCAILKESSSSSAAIANDVLCHFMAGDSQNQKSVLLLLEDEAIADCLVKEIAKKKIESKVPVLIMLNCVRRSFMTKQDNPADRRVILRNQLTEEEKCNFTKKQEDLAKRFPQHHTQFHSFNILCKNFSEEYAKETCKMLRTGHIEENKGSQNVQLLAILSLLNSYVPGSYLLQSECEKFFKEKSQEFECRMSPFNDLIVTFNGQEDDDKRVRMKHPMIAHQCVQCLADAGLTRSDTTVQLVKYFCKGDSHNYLEYFIKDMLIKRNKTQVKKTAGDKELGEGNVRVDKFSKLILDTKKYEGVDKCVEILKKMIEKNEFFCQTLARLYYIEMEDYTSAEHWAKEAKRFNNTSSFIADTLGQIHKSNLRKKIKMLSASEILEMAGKSISAFKEEEVAAENEVKLGPNYFNDRGRFGYLQVAKYLFEALTSRDPRWKDILTGRKKALILGHEFPGETLNKYVPLIEQLREGVKKRYKFFEKYLTYPKDNKGNPEPEYFHADIFDCYKKYTDKMPTSFPGLLSCVDREHIDPGLEWMQQHWKEISSERRSNAQATQNYILVNILLSQEEVIRQVNAIPPQTLETMLKEYVDKQQTDQIEFHLLAFMLFWPGKNSINFLYEDTVNKIRECYERDYSKYYGFRNLVPLFLLGKGKGLSRLIHKTRVDMLILKEPCMSDCPQEERSIKLSGLWSSGEFWKFPGIQDRLLKCNGTVVRYELFLKNYTNRIKIFPDRTESIRDSGPVSFFLGFNIRGPVAFNIVYENA